MTFTTTDTAIIIDGEHESTLADFFAANEAIDADSQREIIEALNSSGRYTENGGGWAGWTIEVVS